MYQWLTSNGLMNACEEAIKKSNIDYQRNGTYVVMEGLNFTLAESNLYRSWKADVIGMTNMLKQNWQERQKLDMHQFLWLQILIAGIQIMKILMFSK